jgi:hypothetical protein
LLASLALSLALAARALARPWLLAAAAAASWAVCAGVHHRLHSRLDAFRADLAAKGYPSSLSAFEEKLPDSLYATPALSDAIAALDPSFARETHPGLELGRWSPATLKKESAYASRYEGALTKTIQPLTRGRFSRYMKIDFAEAAKHPLNAPIPKFSGIIMTGNILSICAVSRAYTGDLARAWEHERSLLGLAGLLAHEHTLIGKMVALSLRRQAAGAVVNIRLAKPSVKLPKDIQEELERTLSDELVADGIKSELAGTFDLRQEFEREPGALAGVFAGGGDGRAVDKLSMIVLRSLGFFDVNFLATARHLSVIASSASDEDKKAAEKTITELPRWPYLLAVIAAPNLEKPRQREKEYKELAQRALAGK